MSDNLSGQVLKSYELYAKIGEGGFGAVYRAHQAVVSRDVAVKVIRSDFANHPDFIRRFEVEAQIVAHLEHPHIVPLYDYWREPNGAYLVMRWLQGGSLSQALKGGAWEPAKAALLLDQVASALMIAHRRDIIHRDIKPDNILLDEDNNAYLADFGIAKVLGSLSSDDTSEGLVVGSLAYISPEQLKGDPVTPQTDIYSLGVVMYELLTGERPFPDTLSQTALIFKHLTEPIPLMVGRFPELAKLDDVLQTACAKEPARRFFDTLSMAEAFRRAVPASSKAPTKKHHTTITQPTVPITIDNPYKGLRPFNEADADDFFGRETLVQNLIDAILEETPFCRFLSVIGPSGSGKSSVVRAGLLPKLRRGAIPGSETWYYAEMFPGSQPLKNLESALLSVAAKPPTHLLEQLHADSRGLLWAIDSVLQGTDGDLLLFIDQFEEAFTLTEDEAERAQFLELLRTAVTASDSRLRVIVTLRADFTDRPLHYANFGELMGQRTRFVLPLSADEIERAINSPAQRVGLSANSDLIAAVVADVRDEPGTLPLLQYALTELFEHRHDNHLTLGAYSANGGVLGALARRAQDVYEHLDEAQQDMARQIFLRLVTLGEGTEDTRRRAKRSELASIAGSTGHLEPILDAFGKYRLLTFDRDVETREPTIEVAHEALIREWDQLRRWLETSRADVRLQRLLAGDVSEWIAAGRSPDFLLTGGRLSQFEEWSAATDLALTADERGFIEASSAARRQQETAEQARIGKEAALERRSRTVLRAFVVVALLAALGGFGLSGIALNERSIAQTQLSIVQQQAQQLRFIALRGGVETALLAEDNDQARALALEAQADDPTGEAQALLADAAYTPGTIRILDGHTLPVIDLKFSPDGKTALSASFDKSIVLWDLATGQIIRRMTGHEGFVSAIAYSPDGKYAVSASTDHTLILWDLATGAIARRFTGARDWLTNVAFSPDGKTILSAGGNLLGALNNAFIRATDTDLILWDAETGQIIRRMSGHTNAVRALAFSPDGIHAVSGGVDNRVIVWNVQTGQIERRFEVNNLVVALAYTPDGKFVLAGGGDPNLQLWDVKTGETVRILRGNNSAAIGVAISPDGRRALSAAYDGTVIYWDIEDGTIIRRLNGHRETVAAVAFSPDGRYAITGGGNLQGALVGGAASKDNTIRLWDLDNGAIVQRILAQDALVSEVAFSSDGKSLLSLSPDALIRSDMTTGQTISQTALSVAPSGAGIVNAAAISPDEHYALMASGATDIVLWDLTNGQEVRHFKGHNRPAVRLKFSRDGQFAFSGGSDGVIIQWDVNTGQQIRRFENSADGMTQIWQIALSPDNQTLLSGGTDGTILLWDVNSGAIIRKFAQASTTGISALAFSADGKTALSGSADNSVILWDVATGTPIRHFVGHTNGINAVALSPNGHLAISGSSDNSVILWNVDTGQIIYRYVEDTAPITAVAFSPDGHYALSGGADRRVILWRIDATADSLLAWTQANRYLRPLTCAERERYGLDAANCTPDATPEVTAQP